MHDEVADNHRELVSNARDRRTSTCDALIAKRVEHLAGQ